MIYPEKREADPNGSSLLQTVTEINNQLLEQL